MVVYYIFCGVKMSRHTVFTLMVDKKVGKKVADRRMSMGLSREQLAEKIGVTHQQLGKYEKGENRVSCGRMVLIAGALCKSVAYFFDGLEADYEEPTRFQRLCMEVARNAANVKDYDFLSSFNATLKLAGSK